jgi:hypothetical protein
MLLEVIRTELLGILDWMGRARETTTALARRLRLTCTGRPFGRMSQKWLEEYDAEAGKHDASR